MADFIDDAIQTANTFSIIYNCEDYRFRQYSFGELGTMISPQLVNQIAHELSSKIRNQCRDEFDMLISPEPGGHIWALLLSYLMNRPLCILRLNNGIVPSTANFSVSVRSLYNFKSLWAELPKGPTRFLLFDDIISSGATISAIVDSLHRHNHSIQAVAAICSRAHVHSINGISVLALRYDTR